MNIQVSIICNAYNHENYIRDALEGFVNQKTTFPFEVLVHDDASTDNTQSIIKEFEKQYPDIIKPIYQSINQYSKGVSIFRQYQLPRAKGKYLAFCEGDDYWIDNNKLQMQYNILEENESIDMCAHRTIVKNDSTNEMHESGGVAENRILSLEEVIKGGGGFLPTASLFFRKSIEIEPPQFRLFYGIDYTLQVLGALKGGIYFINKPMSVYRAFTLNSWTDQMRKDYRKKIVHKRKMNETLSIIDQETGGICHSYFRKEILNNKIKILIMQLLKR